MRLMRTQQPEPQDGCDEADEVANSAAQAETAVK